MRLEFNMGLEQTVFSSLGFGLMQVVCNVFFHSVLGFVRLWFLGVNWILGHFSAKLVEGTHTELIDLSQPDLT